jgi:hypothetical protein
MGPPYRLWRLARLCAAATLRSRSCSGVAIALGLVPRGLHGPCRLSRNRAITYSLLMGFPGGIDVENEAHAAELRRTLERPWPLPRISVVPPLALEVPRATE